MSENKPTPTVERDANGVPESWPLVRAGPVPLRKNGEDYVLELTSKDLSGIVSCRRTQGGKLPPEPRRHPPPAPHFAVIEKDRTAPIYYAPSRFYGIAEIMKQEASAPNIADIPLPRSFVVIAKDRTAPIYYAPPCSMILLTT